MAFLSNKLVLVILAVVVFLYLLGRINYIKDQLKQAKEDLEIYAESEILKQKAYQQYQEKIKNLNEKLSFFKEKYTNAEKNQENIDWLEGVIPTGVDNSIPY